MSFCPGCHGGKLSKPHGADSNNQFVESPWELREFRTDASSGSVLLVPDTIKGNPVTELYDDNSAFSIANPGLKLFPEHIDDQMDSLLTPELNSLTNTIDILTTFEPAFDDQFSNFKSVSQGSVDNPASVASQDVRTLITNAIADRVANGLLPQNTTVNDDHVLNRLGAMTCGGCHQYSSNSGGVAITDTVDGQPLVPPDSLFR